MAAKMQLSLFCGLTDSLPYIVYVQEDHHTVPVVVVASVMPMYCRLNLLTQLSNFVSKQSSSLAMQQLLQVLQLQGSSPPLEMAQPVTCSSLVVALGPKTPVDSFVLGDLSCKYPLLDVLH